MKGRDMQKVVILGAGGLARDVLDVFLAQNSRSPQYDILGFIDEKEEYWGTLLNGFPVLGGFGWFQTRNKEELRVICGIGSPESRRRMAEKANHLGLRFCSIVHPTAVIAPFGQLGEGVVITAGSILANRVVLKNHVYVNLGSTIGHDTVIEEYGNISPGVNISGNVHMKPGCDIGTGAAVLQGITFGEGAVVGAGAAVIRDVPPNSVSVGVPARVVKQRNLPWETEGKKGEKKMGSIHSGAEQRL
jgi:sugar O-acyltransferase (sialic acid O-acetyltransferase NeuD family)